MKKSVISAISAFTITLTCASCMSLEEQQNAREDIKAAEPIVKSYLAENYRGASIASIESLPKKKTSTAVIDFGIYASGCCIASIENGQNDFKVIVDTETKQCWDNMSASDIKQDIGQTLSQFIEGTQPADIEINLFPAELVLSVARDFEGFTDISHKSADNILNDGGYYINAVMKYDKRLDTLTLEKLLEKEFASMVNIQLVKFRDVSYSREDMLPDGETGTNLVFDTELQYLLFEQYEMIKSNRNEEDSGYVFEEPELAEYSVGKAGNLTFAWKNSEIDAEISTIQVESPVSTKYYSGNNFYKVENEGARIDYCCKINNAKLYFYTDEEYDIERPYLVGIADNGNDVANSILLFTDSDDYFGKTLRGCSFSLKDSGSVEFGIYKR